MYIKLVIILLVFLCLLENFIKFINSSNLISFCYGWIVKCSVNEVIYGIVFVFLLYDCLVDVNNFGGMFIEIMNV